MLPVSLDCPFVNDTSVFSNVYFKTNKAIVATLFLLRIRFVNDFISFELFTFVNDVEVYLCTKSL